MKKWYKSLSKRARNIYYFLGSLFIVGVLSGSLFYLLLNETDKSMVINEVARYFELVSSGELNNVQVLRNALIMNMTWVTVIYVLGMSVIGTPVVCFMNFIKGFVVGFSISVILIQYKLYGIVLGFVYITPHVLAMVVVTFILSFLAMQFSYYIVKNMFNNKSYNYKQAFRRYTKVYIFCIGVLILASIWEAFITPQIMRVFTLGMN